jgi:cytochrome P450
LITKSSPKIEYAFFLFTGNGVVLPANCHVAIPSFTLHRRKDIWGEDADEFNPDHFAPGIQRHLYAFIPFSGGPRVCIGYRYAYMSMKTVLAYMLRNYRFTTDMKMDEMEWDFSVTLRLVNKHMVKAERRVWT